MASRWLILLTIVSAVSAAEAQEARDDHWAFQKLRSAAAPVVQRNDLLRTSLDPFIQASLERQGLSIGPDTDRRTLLRRLTLDLVGLPPSPEELAAFEADSSPEAYERAVDRLLVSPRYGERWGKFWLDAVGYADSNGYFNADSDRPLAYKYRDYVIRAFNADKPYDEFVREQLAGDELAGYAAGTPFTPRTIELLTATHFLRNSQDGTSESDGNPDELTIDRATVLEGSLQVTMNSLLGITIQCARCHEHKFEPIEQAEYYALQSIFYPAFPAFHEEKWAKPVGRVIQAATPEQLAVWEAAVKAVESDIAAARSEFAAWLKASRPAATVRFEDAFDGSDASVAKHWSNTAPQDDQPAGTPPVQLDSQDKPGALVRDGALHLRESGQAGDRWLVTRQSFDWTPERVGESVQVSFDLVANTVDGSSPAERVGFCIALHDFSDNAATARGNILFDGNPTGGAAVYVDYPGSDSEQVGQIGKSGYQPGHTFGVRVTNVGGGKFRIEQLIDWLPEEKTLTLTQADLPDGGFGFEYCCNRSFVVDNVIVESTSPANGTDADGVQAFQADLKTRRERLEKLIQEKTAGRPEKPGLLACVTDVLVPAPDVHVLVRGQYAQKGETVAPSGLHVLSDVDNPLQTTLSPNASSTGRRLAFANWLTRPGSQSASLLARVIVNRLWQQHFGTGLVSTPDNFGLAGAVPTHPALLEHLAGELIRNEWRLKPIHRLIVTSGVYRQSSLPREPEAAADPENDLLWRFPLRRLDAESIRDAMLAVSGELDPRIFGPYVPTKRSAEGDVAVDPADPGFRRRAVYLQQRRTQVDTFQELFDSPAMVVTCGQRNRSTIPLQSLALLNSEFVRQRGAACATRLIREQTSDINLRLDRAFQLAYGRGPEDAERQAALQFLKEQEALYSSGQNSSERSWADLCQMLLSGNSFLYVE